MLIKKKFQNFILEYKIDYKNYNSHLKQMNHTLRKTSVKIGSYLVQFRLNITLGNKNEYFNENSS